MLACLHADKGLVEMLLDLHEGSSSTANPPLHHSDVTDALGNTALHLACRGGDLYIVILLITSIKTKEDYTKQPKTLPEVKYVNRKNLVSATCFLFVFSDRYINTYVLV